MPRSNRFTRTGRARRVYFIGAGFSKALGYPLGSELLLELVRRLSGRRKQNNDLYRAAFREASVQLLRSLEDFLQQYMGFRIALQELPEAELKDALSEVNQAEFYSVLHTLAEAPGLFRVGSRSLRKTKREELLDAPQMFAAVAAATRSYFVDVCWTPPLDMPRYFTDLLHQFQADEEAIVTFNWDEEVEGHISEQMQRGDMAIAYTLQSWSSERPYLILKPHGSICWYDMKQGIGNVAPYLIAGGDPRLSRREMSLVTFYEYDAPRDIDLQYHAPLACPPVISPPTFSKRFDYVEQQLIWQDIVDVCVDAEEFVFLGYSLLNDDYLTRSAVRRAILRSRGSARRRIKYLIVSRPTSGVAGPPTHLKTQFASVFGVCDERHFLPWVFGTEKPRQRIRDMIDAQIAEAFVT
jgi:hypothetical protein